MCCIVHVAFCMLYCLRSIKTTSISVTDYRTICLADFLSDSKEDSFFLSWTTRTDSLPYDVYVFIFKLSECKQIEFFAAFIAAFAD